MTTPATTIANASHHSNVVPSEVGWQFVPQYYTYMNKQPNRLHCFYTKNSTFIHGTEGEDIKPCYGQQEIHNKILAIGFQDCKVFIHSVDAQSSANNGIIIQVIGEMSNSGEAWRKFAQTFFLAEQPNGYFVLNDIFRYLKEEAVDTEEMETEVAAGMAEPEIANAEVTEHVPEPVVPIVEEPAVEEPVTVQDTIPEPEEVEQPKVNGIHPATSDSVEAEPEPEVTVAPEPTETVKESSPEPETVAPIEEEVIPKTPEPVQAPTPAATPAAAPPATVSQPPPPAAAPVQPAAPPAPKTWANLAAANSNKWGNAVAQEAKGVSAAAAPAPSPGASGATTPNKDGQLTPNRGPRTDRDSHSPAYQAAMSVTTAQCFVKGVIEVVSHQALLSTLTNRFGPVKEVEIVRTKACAFLEFVNLDSAKRAIIASLPMGQGGEGGIRIDVGEAGQVRINVETRKERGDRPPPRPRGGAPPNGEPRGSFRGRGAPGGRGRGGGPGATGATGAK